MSALGKLVLIAAVGAAAGVGGLVAGEKGITLAMLVDHAKMELAALTGGNAAASSPNATAPSGEVLYYRHPDGIAEWSAMPAATPDGRAFLPVLASEDISFNPEVEKVEPMLADGTGERAILYYRNPMGLPDTSPVPKRDSMGMDYLPVYAGDQGDAGSVSVSAGKQQRSGVRTLIVTEAPLARIVRAPGNVALDERRISVIALRADAFVNQVNDVTTGSAIVAGAPLATLYSPEVTAAAALFVSDMRGGGAARPGSRQRLENLGVPASVIDEMVAQGQAPVEFVLTAPRSGIALERMAVEGMMAEAGETLFRIADTSVVWIMADVPETDLMAIRRGAVAEITFRGLPGEIFAGTVNEIYPEVNMQTRTAKVRIDLPNPEGRLLANMFAEVAISTGDGSPVVQVPETAVIDTGDRQVVIRDMGEGRFAPQDVILGQSGGGMVEIREGIAAGDRIVTTATFLIDAESNLNAALAGLAVPEVPQ
jgi:Cu(I)/Ag(I) efflux system membrane fusion protein